MKNLTDEQKGYTDRKAGYYDKWYRYNRADDGAAYDAGVMRACRVLAIRKTVSESFTLIETLEGNN